MKRVFTVIIQDDEEATEEEIQAGVMFFTGLDRVEVRENREYKEL